MEEAIIINNNNSKNINKANKDTVWIPDMYKTESKLFLLGEIFSQNTRRALIDALHHMVSFV